MRSSSAFEFAPLEATAPPPPSPADVAGGMTVGDVAGVLEAARAEADAIREAARQEGFQAGYADGLAAADDRLAPSVGALGEACAALGLQRLSAAEQVEPHAVDLALRIAEKALGAALEADRERVVDVVRGALRHLIERDRVLVLVNPEDLDVLRSATAGLQASLGGIGELEVQAERRVARGGAIVRTQAGEVDARLETQLERARETMLEALAPSPSPEGAA